MPVRRSRFALLGLVGLVACGDKAPAPAAPPPPVPRVSATTAPACTRVVFGAHVVDAGSDLMQQIRTYVSVEGGQSRTLGGAIRIELEEWSLPGSGGGPFGPSVTTDVFATAADRRRLEAFFVDLARSDPAMAPPPDRKILVEAVAAGWRSYLVHAEAQVTSADVASARAVTDPVDGRQIVLTLTEDGQRALYDVTGENVGRKLALVLDGIVWKAPIIDRRIDGGGLSIAMPPALTQAQLDALVARFTCRP